MPAQDEPVLKLASARPHDCVNDGQKPYRYVKAAMADMEIAITDAQRWSKP
jgi:hypothetical protein